MVSGRRYRMSQPFRSALFTKLLAPFACAQFGSGFQTSYPLPDIPFPRGCHSAYPNADGTTGDRPDAPLTPLQTSGFNRHLNHTNLYAPSGILNSNPFG